MTNVEIVKINFIVPKDWQDLSDKQLCYLFKLLAAEYDVNEIKTLAFVKWSGIKVIGKQKNGAFTIKKGNLIFDLGSVRLAEVLQHLDWLGSIPTYPVRISKIKGHRALPADFEGVPFEKFIMADNLYQGYLTTQQDELLDQLASVVYGHEIKLKQYHRISVFYWIASLKGFFANKFRDFFQPTSEQGNNLLGGSSNIEDAMNAQIRALTKGDITKETEILSMDTWRALTELNAQAKEFKELNSKINTK